MSIWTEVKSWWHVYIVGLFRGPQDTKEESAEEYLARVFPPDEPEWEDE